MYAGLVLGGVALVLLWWLGWTWLGRRKGPEKLLQEEIARRKEAEEGVNLSRERLKAMQAQRLSELDEALTRMRAALPDEAARRVMRWKIEGEKLRLVLGRQGGKGRARPEEVEAAWNLREFDIGALAAGRWRFAAGIWTLRRDNGIENAQEDLTALLRAISALVAERL